MGNALTGLPFGYLVALAYWTVLLAELVGDKSIYLASSLSLRFRPAIVIISMTLGFAGKMLVAVLLGKALVRFNSSLTDLISAAAFFLSASLIWFEEPKVEQEERPANPAWRAVIVCFGSFFFTEWGDPGQI